MEEGGASPVDRSALALPPCGIQGVRGEDPLCASTVPAALHTSTFVTLRVL